MKKIILCCAAICLVLLGAVLGRRLICRSSSWHSASISGPGMSVQGPAARKGFSGIYRLVSESGGQKPGKGANIILNFKTGGALTLRATRPGESLTDIGTFRESNGKITLELPGLEKKVAMQPYSLNGAELVLPLQIIGEAAGTSTWQRLDTKPDAMRAAIEGFRMNLQRLGRTAALKRMAEELQQRPEVREAGVCGGTVLVTYRSGYQEFFLAPEADGKPGSSPAQPVEEESQSEGVMPGCSLLAMAQSAQFLPMRGLGRMATAGLKGEGFAEQAWLANEPQPVSHGDAPPTRKALVLSSFHTLPVLSANGGSFKWDTMADKGENLDGIVKDLKHAKYEVDGPIIDQQVTVKLLMEKLSGKSWGVFFFSTHSGIWNGDQFLLTGEEIPLPFSASPEDREKYLQKYWENFMLTGGNLSNDQFKRVADQLIFGYIYEEDIPFVCVKSGFFQAIGADFSRSLVYLSSCHSSERQNLRNAMQPRAFLGWTGEVAMSLNAEMSSAFFRCLSRRTRSDREAWDFGVKYCKAKFEQEYNQWGQPSKLDARNFQLFRQGRSVPEKELSFHACHLLKVVRNQVCMFKGGKGLNDTVHSLYLCDKKEVSGIKTSPFCLQAFNGQDIPDTELDIVKGECCGYDGQVRFTLEE